MLIDHTPLELENQLVLMGLSSWISDAGGKSTSIGKGLLYARHCTGHSTSHISSFCRWGNPGLEIRGSAATFPIVVLEWVMCTEFSIPLAPVVPGLEHPASYLLRRTEPRHLILVCPGRRTELQWVQIQGQPLLLCPLTLTAPEGKGWLDDRATSGAWSWPKAERAWR